MKALWKGSISFGLVTIPVRLYSGSITHRIDLDMIRRKDRCAIEYVRVCKKDGKEVPWEAIAKGYKKEDGEYIIVDPTDLAQAMPQKTQTIALFEFVPEVEIPSQYLEKPYIVEPEKNAVKAYVLLREALKKSKKVGLVKFILRNSEHLGLLKVEENAILLIQMRFDQDLHNPAEAKIPTDSNIDPKELTMALHIIDQLTGTFEPEKYTDTYKDELLKIIEQKVKEPERKKIVQNTSDKVKKVAADDLLEQLKSSLEALKN